MVMPEEERRNTAYHESGPRHRRAAAAEGTDPVHKVTIIPRGRALGVTVQLPEQDRYSLQPRLPAQQHRGALRRPRSPRSCS